METQGLKMKVKALCVGLGGTGKLALLQLKRKLKYAGIDTASNPKVKLLCIDFDARKAELNLTDVGNATTEQLSLDLGEYLYLDAHEIENRIRSITGEHTEPFYESWYPDMKSEMIGYGIVKGGAAQWRPLGRVGFFEHSDHIHSILRDKLESLMRLQPKAEDDNRDEELIVYIFASSGGGTGAGILIDTCYYIRTIAPQCPVYSLILLPNIYRKWDQHGRLYANSYALLKELGVFVSQSKRFWCEYPDGVIIDYAKNQRPPIDLAFVFDSLVGRNTILPGAEEAAELMADTVFVDIYGSSLFEEQTTYLTNLSRSSGKLKLDTLSEKCLLNVMGSTSIEFPSIELLKRYLRVRFATGFLHQKLSRRGRNVKETAQQEERGASPSPKAEVAAGTPSFSGVSNETAMSITLEGTRKDLQAARKILEDLPRWEEVERWRMARRMYASIEMERGSADACKRTLDGWRDKFVGGKRGQSLSFPSAPQWLPNEEPGKVSETVNEFKNKLLAHLAYLQKQASGAVETERVFACHQSLREQPFVCSPS